MPVFAPICLFAYNRPKHLQKTLSALANNGLAEKSPIRIYIDGPAAPVDRPLVEDSHSTCLDFKQKFASMKLVSREQNSGLAKNIVTGIEETLEQYDRAIILEDDIITSPFFLDYLNSALTLYENHDNIGHINCFSCRQQLGNSAFLTDLMMCWGWATWKHQWQKFSKDFNVIDQAMTDEKILSFTQRGRIKNWQQYLDNKVGKTNTWAVFWAISLHINSLYCVHPPNSLSHNIGNDGTGTNAKGNNHFDVSPTDQLPVLPKSPDFNRDLTNTLVNRLFPGKAK